MISLREIEKRTMSSEKKKAAKNDYFAFYVGRPLSYLLTIPFLYTNISPNVVSILSIIPLLLGFILVSFGTSENMLLLGWGMFFLWNLLDGVDGNIARYKKQFSPLGSVYDAMSGYIAMVLSFFAWGIAAAHNTEYLNNYLLVSSEIFIIIGAFSGIFVIFPRLIMHKALSTLSDQRTMDIIKDKSKFGVAKLIVLNLTSVSGFAQVLMLLAIIMDIMDLFTLGYFVLNFLVLLFSLKSILSEKRGKCESTK